MNAGRYYASPAIVNGYIYVAGGFTSANTSLTSVELYDPNSDDWAQLTPMANACRSVALIKWNGFVYAFGSLPAVSSRYDPWTCRWLEV